jgi:hypothetical protein
MLSGDWIGGVSGTHVSPLLSILFQKTFKLFSSHLVSLLLPVALWFVAAWKRSAHLTSTSSGSHVLRATSMKMKNDFMLSLIFQFFIKIFVSYNSEILELHVFWYCTVRTVQLYCTYRAICSVINLYSQLYMHKNIYTLDVSKSTCFGTS